MTVAVIAAVSANGVIGQEGGLPWYYSEDLQYFKSVTMGSPVVMGRRTFESIVDRLGEPLPGRTNVVLTRSGLDTSEDVIVSQSLESGIDRAEELTDDTSYVIGGGSIFEQVIEDGLADRLVITHIDETYDGDTYWPGPAFENLEVLDRTRLGENLEAVTYRL